MKKGRLSGYPFWSVDNVKIEFDQKCIKNTSEEKFKCSGMNPDPASGLK